MLSFPLTGCGAKGVGGSYMHQVRCYTLYWPANDQSAVTIEQATPSAVRQAAMDGHAAWKPSQQLRTGSRAWHLPVEQQPVHAYNRGESGSDLIANMKLPAAGRRRSYHRVRLCPAANQHRMILEALEHALIMAAGSI